MHKRLPKILNHAGVGLGGSIHLKSLTSNCGHSCVHGEESCKMVHHHGIVQVAT